jgi:hypothetical protein
MHTCVCRSAAVFWDAVVLTATDDAQAESYRQQLQAKQAAKEIPSGRCVVQCDTYPSCGKHDHGM